MRPTALVRCLAAAAALAVLIGACGANNGHQSLTTHASSAPASVTISGYAYKPDRITVSPGTRITLTNRDQTAHTATDDHSRFDAGTIKPGKSATIVVTTPGRYTYYCQFHAFMRGTLIVR